MAQDEVTPEAGDDLPAGRWRRTTREWHIEDIGFIGLGTMGGAMAAYLLRAVHRVFPPRPAPGSNRASSAPPTSRIACLKAKARALSVISPVVT